MLELGIHCKVEAKELSALLAYLFTDGADVRLV